ncbi:MAG: MBL fold metallo-hydrolase [Acidobacteria bacterium]|nr:MBL fold metallo-hydrolase [Acidobacteriota bacterium]
MIGCDCDVCRSPDPRDKRFRPSIYVECDDGSCVLVDTTPDLRTQALVHDLRKVDAVVLTHAHADHVMGLDEVRRFNAISGRAMPIHGDAETLESVARIFAYAFAPDAPRGGGVPHLDLVPITGPFQVGAQAIVPVPVQHGRWGVLGFRFGAFAYLTDTNRIPESSMPLLLGLDVLVIDALRKRKHPTHFTLEEAVQAARRIAPRLTYFTHISHELGHAATNSELPDGMALAYDGLTIEPR